MKVDFFLIGAAKSGTTSMARYLSEHPEICFANPKEPQFFSSDYATTSPHDGTLESYHSLFFNHYDPQKHRVVGEGSVFYLPSEVAVKKILEYNPDARFIVMLRNPVDMAISWHSDLCLGGHETCLSFLDAWNMQELRKQGKKIPFSCIEPKLLQYKEFCSVGTQIQEFIKNIDRERVCFIFFDDFAQDPKSEYEKILIFLGVSPDNRSEFPPANTGRQWENPLSAYIYRVMLFLIKLKRSLGVRKGFGLTHFIGKRLATTRRDRGCDLDEMRNFLSKEFVEQVMLLEAIFNRRMTSWSK